MLKEKEGRNKYLKKKHAKLCKEKQEEEKKKQKKLLEIKDGNEVLKYIKRERQQREYADENIQEEEWIRHFMKLLKEQEEKRGTTANNNEEQKNHCEIKERFIITEEEIDRVIERD